MSQPAKWSTINFWMLLKWFWSSTIIKQQKQQHYINRQTDTLDNSLTPSPILKGWEMSVKSYLNWQFGWIDEPDSSFGDRSVRTQIWTPCASPEPLLTLVVGTPRLVFGASWLVFGAPRCSPGCHQTFYDHPDCLPVLPVALKRRCITAVNYGIWPPRDSGPATPRHSQRLPVTKIHFPNETLESAEYKTVITMVITAS